MIRALASTLVIALLAASVLLADAFPILGHRQAPTGFGWRLLSQVDDKAEMAFRVRAATDRASFGALWQDLGLNSRPRRDFTDIPPWLAVDFEREIVVLFGVGTNSCTDSVSLDEVVIDRESRVVHSVTSQQGHCGHLDLSGAVVLVVALDRAVLPPSPFTVQLHAEPTCRSCREPDDRLTLTL
ncbi:MAG: hypothetical protein ABI797_05380 [Chloroflexota bacterium]